MVLTVTLSKSLGAQGGAVLGHPAVREHLVNTARSFIYDTGLAPASAGAALAALRALEHDPSLAAKVRAQRRDPGRGLRRRAARRRGALGPDARAARGARGGRDLRRRTASGSGASARRRPPTASPGCGSPPTPTTRARTSARAAKVLADVTGGMHR